MAIEIIITGVGTVANFLAECDEFSEFLKRFIFYT